MANEGDRINNKEHQFIDMRLAVSRLLENTVVYQHKFEIHQRNFEAMNDKFLSTITEIKDIRADMLRQTSEDEMSH